MREWLATTIIMAGLSVLALAVILRDNRVDVSPEPSSSPTSSPSPSPDLAPSFLPSPSASPMSFSIIRSGADDRFGDDD